ncbi:hypothetical protein OAP67_03665 [Candidatus Pelagibacter sp.]|nr:hypothetical protein [Candidatus Pelagibacter sp.]
MQKKSNNFLINGNGFRSITAALMLRKRFPKAKINLEKNKSFGGIYSSIKFKNFHLDLGCHLFDYTDDEFLKLYEIRSAKIIPLDLKYKSINNYGSTNGYAIYDFRNNPEIKLLQKNFFSNIKKKRQNYKIDNLNDLYLKKYGPLIKKKIEKIVTKITGLSLKKISSRSNQFFMFDRILLFNTKESLKFKSMGFDNDLATPSKYNHDYSKKKIIFTFVNGTRGFVQHVENLFKRKNIGFDQKKNQKRICVVNPISETKIIEKYAVNVPLHIIYLECKKFPYTYFHDFSDGPIFRVSSPGFYSNQYKNKKSYVCIEIPDPKNLFSKNDLIDYSINYINKYSKAKYLNYFFVSKSYPSIYKSSLKSKKIKYSFDYSKKLIFKNTKQLINEIK